MLSTLPYAIGFAFVGAFVGEGIGALAGFAIGVLAALHLQLRTRIESLERRVGAQPAQHTPAIGAEAPPPAPVQQHDEEPAPAPAYRQPAAAPAAITPPADDAWIAAVAPPPPVAAPAVDAVDAGIPPLQPAPARPDPFSTAILWLKTWLTTGNVVAKVGVLILFVGVSFLLKYAAERNAFPVETRLAATAAGALALIAFGWRLRGTRAAFGLIMQGGGIGLLYLTVFAATRLTEALPLGAAFALLLVLVGLSTLLAVLQDSRALATLGTIGGFLAPVLTSSGSGSHVALFSYYALLNLGIVTIAWFRSWRILNWVGFVFTFVIGGAWGYRYYQPEFFASTEPFLILSFLFYFVVSVLFAARQPVRLRGYVDGTLVFGLPLVVFGLQAQLVRDIPFARAGTAIAMAALYLAAARWLLVRGSASMRMLTEAFLALGVIALSLAIPFAFDGHSTAASWALEGAGLVWIGIRQNRSLARVFGLLLQLGAGVAFFAMHSHAPDGALFVLNARYLGGMLIALAALVASWLLARAAGALRPQEGFAAPALLVWGLLWWFGAGLHEIGLHVAAELEPAAVLLFVAGSIAALAEIARRKDWEAAALATSAWPPALALIALLSFTAGSPGGPVVDLRWLGWIACLAATAFVLVRGETRWPREVLRSGHALGWWIALFVAAWSASWLLGDALPGGVWSLLAWGVVPAVALIAMARSIDRLPAPFAGWRALYLVDAQLPVAGWIVLWVLAACRAAGDPAPLPYVPLLNPLDLAQAGSLLLALDWWLRARREPAPWAALAAHRAVPLTIAAAAFLWLNAATARGVHAIAGVAWTPEALHHSAVFQGSISVLWGITALAVMVCATRIGQRALWIAGGALLAALVAKLFLVDLAGSGTVWRIVSFMAAGGLMMLIGYLSPAPPRAAAEKSP